MSYDFDHLFRRVSAELDQSPRTSISALSRQLGVDRHTIGRAVHASTGRTFRAWQRELLYARACKLLQTESTKSIKEIAVLLGYGSTRAFGRFLARTCGCTPTVLRAARAAACDTAPRQTVHD